MSDDSSGRPISVDGAPPAAGGSSADPGKLPSIPSPTDAPRPAPTNPPAHSSSPSSAARARTSTIPGGAGVMSTATQLSPSSPPNIIASAPVVPAAAMDPVTVRKPVSFPAAALPPTIPSFDEPVTTRVPFGKLPAAAYPPPAPAPAAGSAPAASTEVPASSGEGGAARRRTSRRNLKIPDDVVGAQIHQGASPALPAEERVQPQRPAVPRPDPSVQTSAPAMPIVDESTITIIRPFQIISIGSDLPPVEAAPTRSSDPDGGFTPLMPDSLLASVLTGFDDSGWTPLAPDAHLPPPARMPSPAVRSALPAPRSPPVVAPPPPIASPPLVAPAPIASPAVVASFSVVDSSGADDWDLVTQVDQGASARALLEPLPVDQRTLDDIEAAAEAAMHSFPISDTPTGPDEIDAEEIPDRDLDFGSTVDEIPIDLIDEAPKLKKPPPPPPIKARAADVPITPVPSPLPAPHAAISSPPQSAVPAASVVVAAASQPGSDSRPAPAVALVSSPPSAPVASAQPASLPPLEPLSRRRTKPWWEELFGDDYLRTMDKVDPKFVHREVDFIEESLGVEKGAVILDLACGGGLHAVELASRGYSVVGYDLSLAMLARAADEAQDRGQKLNFLQGDMREMAFEEMFDGVYCWSTSFGYFDDEKNLSVLQRTHRALRQGGMLLLDVVNRDYVAPRQPSLVWFEGEGCVCMDEMHVDFFSSRLRVKRTAMFEDGRSRELDYSIRLYALHELGKILHDCGFKVVEVTGHPAHPGVFFGSESPRVIVLAERA